jgi:tetratricopeptide (TPR) repeat protein
VIKPRHTPRSQVTTTAGSQFTDRVDFITAFHTAISAPRPPHRVLVYYGVGGIGKTTLRKELARQFTEEEPGGLWYTIDFVMPSLRGPEAALAALVWGLTHDQDGNWRRGGPAFAAFELAYATYLQKVEPHKPIKEYRDVPLFDDNSLLFQTASTIWDMASTSVSVLKLVNRVRKELKDYFTKQQYEELADLIHLEPKQILEQLPYFFAVDLLAWLHRTRKGGRTERGPVVICLDTYEALWEKRTEGTEFLIDDWVRELIANLPEVLWVICGREKLRWDERDPEWAEALDQHIIGRMADADVRLFLTRRGVTDPAVQEQIRLASEGVPFYLDLSVNTYEEIQRTREPRPEDFTPVRSELMDRFLHYLSQPETVTLRILSTARWWDEELFDHLIRDFQTAYSSAGFTDLMRFSFIQPGGIPGAFTMHQLMRENLRGTTPPELIRKIHRSIAHHYGERNLTADAHETWIRQEQIFHLVHCDEAAGIALFQETAERYVRLGYANRLRSLVADADTYALRHEASLLWVQYYRARVRHLEGMAREAAATYDELRRLPAADLKLRAYAACDLADVWVHSRLRQPGARAEIEALCAAIEAMPVQDAKTAQVWTCRRSIHSFDLDWPRVTDCTMKLLDLYRQYGDVLGVAHSLKLLKSTLFLDGNWPEYFDFARRAPAILAELGSEVAAHYAPVLNHRGILWAGRYCEAEPFLREQLKEVREFEHTGELTGALLNVGVVLGLQHKFAEAEPYFRELVQIQEQRGNRMGRASALGFYGKIKGLAGELESAIDFLRERRDMDVSDGNPNGTSEAFVWLVKSWRCGHAGSATGGRRPQRRWPRRMRTIRRA